MSTSGSTCDRTVTKGRKQSQKEEISRRKEENSHRKKKTVAEGIEQSQQDAVCSSSDCRVSTSGRTCIATAHQTCMRAKRGPLTGQKGPLLAYDGTERPCMET